MREINKDQIEQAVRQILEAIGEDPNREGLLDTPKKSQRCTLKYLRV